MTGYTQYVNSQYACIQAADKSGAHVNGVFLAAAARRQGVRQERSFAKESPAVTGKRQSDNSTERAATRIHNAAVAFETRVQVYPPCRKLSSSNSKRNHQRAAVVLLAVGACARATARRLSHPLAPTASIATRYSSMDAPATPQNPFEYTICLGPC